MNSIIIKEGQIENTSSVKFSSSNNKVNIDIYEDTILDFVEYDSNVEEYIFNIKSNITVTINHKKYGINKDNNIKYNILEDSLLTINNFYYVFSMTSSINIDLVGNNSKVIFNFSTVSKNTSNKFTININHFGNKTTSELFNKAINNNSSLKFYINGTIKEESFDSILNQDTKIINFNEAKSLVEPNLFIDNKDSSANHGAAINKFRDSDFFYMYTRGLDYDIAVDLLIKGFILSRIKSICDDEILSILNEFRR